MRPTIGRIVHYRLTGYDCAGMSRGAHAVGDIVPMIVVRVTDDIGGAPRVSGQAFLDGPEMMWIPSALEGTEPGTWAWPPKV